MGPPAKRGKAKAPAKTQIITPTETAPAQEIPIEASKKAGKFKLGWSLIPVAVVAAVVVVGLGIAAWWWFAGSSTEELIFKDDFSSSDSGWWTGSSD